MQKKSKPALAAHTSASSRGVGDYYGMGLRNKVGRVIRGFGATQEERPEEMLSEKPRKRL